MEKVKQKLHIYNSYLEINNEDISDLNLEYGFGNHSIVHYSKEGKKTKAEITPCIMFDISGKTKDKKEAYLSFEVNLGLNDLNKISKKPFDISRYIFFDGPCCQLGDSESLFLNFRRKTDKIDDMYRKSGEAYVFKKKKNIFIFKLFIPDENIFTYFEVDFNERKTKKC